VVRALLTFAIFVRKNPAALFKPAIDSAASSADSLPSHTHHPDARVAQLELDEGGELLLDEIANPTGSCKLFGHLFTRRIGTWARRYSVRAISRTWKTSILSPTFTSL
jgi:hypothetical protein